VSNRTERDAASDATRGADETTMPDHPVMERYLHAIDEVVRRRLPPGRVRERLSELKRAAEAMPNVLDPEWERLVAELARYGLQVVRSWIMILQPAGDSVGDAWSAAWQRLTPQVVESLASETAARGIDAFRREILRPRWWARDTGPELRTVFLMECAMQLPNSFRSWLLKTDQLSVDAQEWWFVREESEIGSELLGLLEHRVRREPHSVAGALRPAGLTEPEIAEVVGATRDMFDLMADVRHRDQQWGES
jgi:hypothetical protein